MPRTVIRRSGCAGSSSIFWRSHATCTSTVREETSLHRQLGIADLGGLPTGKSQRVHQREGVNFLALLHLRFLDRLERFRRVKREQPNAPRPYKVPGYPVVPWVFIIFSVIYLGFTVYNDIGLYRAAVAEGKPAMINSVFGIALVLIGTPIYFFYRRTGKKDSG